MGPRLPGDRGPSPRPDKPKSLTHNPFAALAAKVQAGHPEAAPEAAADSIPPPPSEVVMPEVLQAEVLAPAPEPTPDPAATPGGEPTP